MNFANVKSITIPEGDVKSVAIGGVTVWTKPNPLPYDAEVEYIESTGTQYVDTGYIPTHASAFDVRFAPTNVDFVAHAVYGNAWAGTANYSPDERAPLTLWTGNGFNNRFFNSPLAISGYEVGRAYSVRQSAVGIVRDGVSLGTYDQSQFRPPPNEPIWVFGCMNGNVNAFGLLRLHSLAISESGALVRSFVPVRVGQVGYLYDRANPNGGPLGNGLYGSATGTALVAGPDRNGGAA